MTFDELLKAICANMAARKLDLIVAVHDGAHFIETPNPVTVISGVKALGPAVCLLPRDGDMRLIATPYDLKPGWREFCRGARALGEVDVERGLSLFLSAVLQNARNIGTAGLAAAASDIATRITELIPNAVTADDVVFDAAAAKTV